MRFILKFTFTLALALILNSALPVSAQQLTYPAEQTANQFINTNQFTVGVQFGPVTFVQLSTLTPASGTIIWCSNCTTNSDPCTASGTGSFAYYQSGAWACTSNSGGGGGSISLILGSANQISVTGGSGPTAQLFLSNPLITPGGATISGNATITGNESVNGTLLINSTSTFTGLLTANGGVTTTSLTATSVTDSGLTAGNCVQATTGGQLTTIVGACGTSTGSVTVTGSPASGNLTEFSGSTSITNGNLSGDVTTSNTLVTTVAKVDGVSYPASPSTNTVPVVTASNTVTYEIVPVAAGGSGTGSTLTGIMRGGSPFTASELSGDASTSGSNLVTVAGLLSHALPSLSTGCLEYTGTAWMFLSGCSGGGSSSLSALTAATTTNSISNGNNAQTWKWSLTGASTVGFTLTESSASTGGTPNSQALFSLATLTGSTAIPLSITNSLSGAQTLPALNIGCTWNTTGVVDACLFLNVTNATSAANSLLTDFQFGGASQWNVTESGVTTQQGPLNVASDGVHAGSIQLIGNTIPASLGANSFAWLGPNVASFTSWGIQMSATPPSNPSVLSLSAVSAGISQGSPISLQGTDSKVLTAGVISGTSVTLCTDASGGATTSGCGGTSVPWSSLANPITSLTLSMGINPTEFISSDYGSSPVAGIFTFTTTSTSTTDTSTQVLINTPAGSYENPFTVAVDGFDQLQVCNTDGSLHIGIIVLGNLIPCANLSTAPFSKLWDIHGSNDYVATFFSYATSGYTSNIVQIESAQVAGTGFNFLNGCVSASTTSGACATSLWNIRGDGQFITNGGFTGNAQGILDASAPQFASTDACAEMKSANETTIGGDIATVVSGRAFQASTIACANPPLSSSDAADIYLPSGKFLTQNTWVLNESSGLTGAWIHGTGVSGSTAYQKTTLQLQNAATAPTAEAVIHMGVTNTFQGSGFDHGTLLGNSLAGTIGIQDYLCQETCGYDYIKIQDTTVAGADFGNGTEKSQHGINLTNFNIGVTTAGAASFGPGVTMTVTSAAVSSSSAGIATATVTSTTGLFVGNEVIITGLPLGGSHSVNFNGTYDVTSVPNGTTFTYQINTASTDSSTCSGSCVATTYDIPLRIWGANGSSARAVRNGTINVDNASTTIPAGAYCAEFSGYMGIIVENLHVEGCYTAVDIGGLGPTSNIEWDGGDLDSGSSTNYVHVGIQISNQFVVRNVIIRNLTLRGFGSGLTPVDSLVDLRNGNTITYANNPVITEYTLDGGGFPHALLANCADMTNGWCDDGNEHSLWVAGVQTNCISDVAGTSCSPSPSSVFVTSPVNITNTTLQAIPGLTLPTLSADTVYYRGTCSIMWQQDSSAAGVTFGIGTSTGAGIFAVSPATIWNGTTMTGGIPVSTTSTGPFAITGTITPAAITTTYKIDVDFTIQAPALPISVTLYGETNNADDSLIIVQGSSCGWLP